MLASTRKPGEREKNAATTAASQLEKKMAAQTNYCSLHT